MPRPLQWTVKESTPLVLETTTADGRRFQVKLSIAVASLRELDGPVMNAFPMSNGQAPPNIEFNVSVVTQVEPV